MTDAVKLLTEAEARAIYIAATSPDDFNNRLRERGLIAPEPTCPLLIEARAVVARNSSWRLSDEDRAACLDGKYDSGEYVCLALAALKRGMEMRPPLTREMVREALVDAGIYHLLPGQVEDNKIDRLHAALTKEQS